MAQRQLSRTLPKNFTFPSLSADGPKTPERPSASIEVPPPPRHSVSSCRLPRVRVRSGTDVCARMDLDLFRFQGLSDVPLPSIEVPQKQTTATESPFVNEPINDERYLAPPRQRMDFKTPEAQIRGTDIDSWDTPNPWLSWDHTPSSITRPGSACSSYSDSSIESIETLASRPSVGGSCTSAESDIFEPGFPLEYSKDSEMESPTLPKKQKMLRAHTTDSSWTREMDNHLWNIYQLYLQDPTMTPFKMTPGSIPPLGVTSRVARRAKRTWEKRHRITDILAPQSAERSGSSTPKAVDGAASPVWPKSDTKTRRRLKLLCRRKFCIKPHYQRMMQSRSPEPLADMLGTTRVSHFADNSLAYGTRELGVSLVSDYQPTPLAQLAHPPVLAEPSNEWFNQPVQTTPAESVTQVSSQHLSVESAHNIPRLGSPFVYSTWAPGGSSRQVESLPVSSRTVHIPGRRLRRNTHLERSPRLADGCISKDARGDREPSDEEVKRRLESYIRENKFQSVGHGRVRIRNRNRGATTTGAVAPRDVDQLFSPPSSLNSSHAEETSPGVKPPVNPLLRLQGENIKRLGSPFKVEGSFKRREAPGRSFRHAPSLSDPFSSNGLPSYPGPMLDPSPILEQEKPRGPLLQDPFEEGLSDAERIRRQLLNRSFMRN